MVVTVTPPGSPPGVNVTVEDSSGNGIANATVLVLDSKGKKFPAKTNASGTATVRGLPDGDYTVYAVATGYLPKAGQVTQTDGSGSVTIQLRSGELGTSDITVTRLNYQQILDAGIDPNDPVQPERDRVHDPPLLQRHWLLHRLRWPHDRWRERRRLLRRGRRRWRRWWRRRVHVRPLHVRVRR